MYDRARFRHVQEVQLYRAPTKRGAPTNEGPRATAYPNKGSLSQKGVNAIGICFDERQKNASSFGYIL